MTTQHDLESRWERAWKKADKSLELVHKGNGCYHRWTILHPQKVKDFMRKELDKARKEGYVKGVAMGKSKDTEFYKNSAYADGKEIGAIDARKEAITKVNKLPKYPSAMVVIKEVDGKRWLDGSKNNLVRLDDVLAILRKEQS